MQLVNREWCNLSVMDCQSDLMKLELVFSPIENCSLRKVRAKSLKLKKLHFSIISMNNIAFDEIPGGWKITAVNHEQPPLITTVINAISGTYFSISRISIYHTLNSFDMHQIPTRYFTSNLEQVGTASNKRQVTDSNWWSSCLF